MVRSLFLEGNTDDLTGKRDPCIWKEFALAHSSSKLECSVRNLLLKFRTILYKTDLLFNILLLVSKPINREDIDG